MTMVAIWDRKLASPSWRRWSWLLGLAGLVAGCGAGQNGGDRNGDSPRREALGGGALTPVKVTVLSDTAGGSGAAGGDAAGASGPKITTFGTFRGKITVAGTPPTLPPLVPQGQQQKDAICSKEAVPNEAVVVGPGNGLGNVFVYLRRIPNVDVPPPASDPVVIDQKGCKFVPHALIVRVGQPLKMLNSDPVAHNVMFNASTFSFNNTLNANDSVGMEVTYQRAERFPIPAACSFHGWMQAYQLAVDHPWAALTQPDGSFVIENVPAGVMEFVIWHEKAGYIEKSIKITVPADSEVERNFEVNASALAG